MASTPPPISFDKHIPTIDERDRFYISQIISLKGLIDERDRLYDSRFKSAEVAVSAAFAAQEKTVTVAFLASEKAVLKAEQAQKEYNERSNEFRGQLDDQAKTLMPRPETLTMFKSLEEKLTTSQTVYDARLIATSVSFKSELVALQVSFEKTIEGLESQVSSLRDTRSNISGRDTANQDRGMSINNTIVAYAAVVIIIVDIILHFVKV